MNKDALLAYLGKTVKVDRGGPESREGKVLAVECDYVALLTKDDGVVYYKLQHIKSITVDSKAGPVQENVEGEVAPYKGDDFQSVISNFKNCWVKVNRGGPEKLEGILNEISKDYVTIISKQEVIQLAMFHIRNISFSPVEQKEEEQQEQQEQQKQQSSRNGRRR